jgi:hypothetical protein
MDLVYLIEWEVVNINRNCNVIDPDYIVGLPVKILKALLPSSISIF